MSMRLVNYRVLNNNKEQVYEGSYCYLSYMWQAMYAQIEYELQKLDIKPNTGLTILFVNPSTNKKTVVNY